MAKTLGVTFSIGAKVGASVASAFATVEQKIRVSQSKMRELSDKAKVLAAADAARQRVVATQRAYAASGGRDPMLREALQQELTAFNKAATAAKKYGVEVANISRAHAQADKALAQTRTRLEALQRAQSFKAKRQEAAESIRAAAVPALAIAEPIREAIRFESAMASAAKTIDGMRDDAGQLTSQYYEMEAAIRQMGQTLPLAHDELAKLFAAGGQQGMTAVSDLREFTTIAAQMAVAFDMSTEQAADAIGGYRSALNLTMPEARNLLDLMNQYANTTSASEKGIADIVRRVGSLGAVGGVAAKPMTALAATLDAMKVAPEVAATGIKNLILAMTAGSAATKSQVAAFGKLGINTVKLAKQMQVDGPAAIISVLEAVKKLPRAQQLSTMQQIFGKESLGSIAPLLANLDKVKENLEICGDESKYAGAMQQEFGNVSGTTANKLILLKNRLQEVGITVAGALLPAIQSLTETIGPPISAIAKFAGEHKNLTTAVIGVASALIGLKVGIGAVTWIVSGIAGSFNLAKAAFTGLSSVTKVATGAQAAFNAVMSLNPVGIAVVAVAALAGGLVYLYNACEPVRAAFDAAFTWIGEKVSSVTDFIGTLFGKVKSGIQTVKSAWRTVKGWVGLGGDEEIATPEVKAPEIQTVAKPQMPGQANPIYKTNGSSEPRAAEPQATAQVAAVVVPQSQAAVQKRHVGQSPQISAQPIQGAATQAHKPDVRQTGRKGEERQEKRPEIPTPQQSDFGALIAQMRETIKGSELAKGAQSAKPEPHVTAQVAAVAGSQSQAVVQKPQVIQSPQISAQPIQVATTPVHRPEVRQTGRKGENRQEKRPEIPTPQQSDFGALIAQMRETIKGSELAKGAQPAKPEPQIIQPQVQVAVNVTQNGIPEQSFANGVMTAIKNRQSELEAIISEIVNEQARLAYG